MLLLTEKFYALETFKFRKIHVTYSYNIDYYAFPIHSRLPNHLWISYVISDYEDIKDKTLESNLC